MFGSIGRFIGSFFNRSKDRDIRAYGYFDAAFPSQTNVENWGHVRPETIEDITDPDSIQRLRQTSLYEVVNDDALNGMVAVAAESIVGRGPMLSVQIKRKRNKRYRELEQAIEFYWGQWCLDTNYFETLRTAEKDLQQYGAYYRRAAYNPYKLQSLDAQLVSPLRIANPANYYNGDFIIIQDEQFQIFNGIAFDEYKNERYYCVLQRPVFSNDYYNNINYEWVDAAYMCHVFDPSFSEQIDGFPMTTPSLEKGVMRRLYEKDELRAARINSTFTGTIKTTGDYKVMFDHLSPKQRESLNNDFMNAQEMNGTSVQLPIANFINLPPYAEAEAFDSNHPHSGFVPYRQESLKGQGRSLRMPEYVALGSCAAYNYASVQKDSQWWVRHASVFRQQIEIKDLTKLFRRWLSVAIWIIPDLVRESKRARVDFGEVQNEIYPSIHWEEEEHADPVKQTTSTILKMRAGILSISDAMIAEGKDPESQKELVKRDWDEMKDYVVLDNGVLLTSLLRDTDESDVQTTTPKEPKTND
jgi:capsid protein